MSMVANQDVYILFNITSRVLDANSFSLALDKLAASVQQWGAKEMDCVIGSGLQNTTAEGVFQVRLGREIFTAGTGIGTSLPFSTFSIAATTALDATLAPIVTATRVSSDLVSGDNITAAGHSTNAIKGTGPLLPYLSSQASSANYSMAQHTELDSSSMPASTVEPQYPVPSALRSDVAAPQDQKGSSASGSAALRAGNLTGGFFSYSTSSGTSGSASSPISMVGSIKGTGFPSLNISVMYSGCSAGLCPPKTVSPDPKTATITISSILSSLNAPFSKDYTDVADGNLTSRSSGSTLGTGLGSIATALAVSFSSAPGNSSNSVAFFTASLSPNSSSVASSSQSLVLPGSSSPATQSSSSVPPPIFTSSTLSAPVRSSDGTATITSKSSLVGLEAVEASVAGTYSSH